MSLPLKVSAVALKEVTEIQRFVEQSKNGMGVRFREDLEHSCGSSSNYPEEHRCDMGSIGPFRSNPLDITSSTLSARVAL